MKLNRFERLVFAMIPNFVLKRILFRLKRYSFFIDTEYITFNMWYKQKVLGFSEDAYWPVHHSSTIVGSKNIYCGRGTCPGYSPGNYIQGIGKIYIGDYTQIAANVGIISANHDHYDNRLHIQTNVRIGRYCWIGIGAIILPGVELGDFTIVGAGAIVTKSFPEGCCVIAGNPARKIRALEKGKCVEYRHSVEYNGYIPAHDFDEYRRKHLNV